MKNTYFPECQLAYFAKGNDLLSPHAIETSPFPSGRPPWDLISEKYCMVVNGERQQIF